MFQNLKETDIESQSSSDQKLSQLFKANNLKIDNYLAFNESDTQFLITNNFHVFDLEQTSSEISAEHRNLLDVTEVGSSTCESESQETTNKTKTPNNAKKKSKIIKLSRRIYCCVFCDQTFSNIFSIRQHKKKDHVLIKPYKCNSTNCGQSFNLEKNLKIHSYTHNIYVGKSFSCPECGLILNRKSSFRGHIKNHQINDYLQCKECSLNFEYQELLNVHVNSVHKDGSDSAVKQLLKTKKPKAIALKKRSGKALCKVCNKTFVKQSLLLRHKSSHQNNKRFECSNCNKKFAQKSSLIRHQKQHNQNGHSKFKCPKCSQSFLQKSNLVTHVKRVHPITTNLDDKFPCTFCSCVFNKLNSFNRHINHHMEDRLSEPSKHINDYDEESVKHVIEQFKDLQKNFVSEELNNSVLPVPAPAINQIRVSQPVTAKDKNTVKIMKLIDNLNPLKEKSFKYAKLLFENNVRYLGCVYCVKRFKKPSDLLRHIKTHTNEKPYVCEICERGFAIKTTLETHMKVHQKSDSFTTKLYKCSVCHKPFDSLRKLNIHTRIHSNIKTFKCDRCLKHFRTSSSLSVHKRRLHAEKNVEIELLKNLLMSPIEKGNESKLEEKSREYDLRLHQCSICGKKFKKLSHLKEHETRHSSVRHFQCNTCMRLFSTKSSLNFHQKIKTRHKSFECTICSSKFLRKGDLKWHNKIVHCSTRNFICSYCNKAFKTRAACKTHTSIHLTNVLDSQPVDTKVVEIASTSQYRYSLSKKENVNVDTDNDTVPLGFKDTNSESENDWCASESGPKFINLKEVHNFKNHRLKNFTIESIASPATQIAESSISVLDQNLAKPNLHSTKHKCEFCEKSFQKPNDLLRHQRTHTKEKPFACKICSKAFSLKSTLNYHNKTHMKDREKFSCQVCGKTFASKKVVSIHLRLHTNEMPFECDICNKKFRTSGHKISHQKEHTKKSI